MITVLIILGGAVHSKAEATTTTDVFHAVNEIISEVVRLHDANFTNASGSMIRSEGRLPRHVMQMARTVLKKANLLASINDGTIAPMPWLPSWEITPTDVMIVVQPTAQLIQELKPVFGVEGNVAPASSEGSKDPDDVYAALYFLSQMIDGLGIPRSVPNDAYQIADTIVSQLMILAHRYDVPLRPPRAGNPGKKTHDVYAHAFELVHAIDRLIAARPELDPTGGVALMHQRSGRIDQEHVIHTLNDLLAEVVAMRAAIGDKKQVREPKPVSGMDPSDVYNRLSDALAIVEDLSEAS